MHFYKTIYFYVLISPRLSINRSFSNIVTMSFFPTNNTEGWSKLPHGNWSLFTLQNKHVFCWGGSMLTAPSNLCSQRGQQNPGILTYLSRLRCKMTCFWSHVPSLSAGSLVHFSHTTRNHAASLCSGCNAGVRFKAEHRSELGLVWPNASLCL